MTQDELKLVLDALKWCHGGEPCGTSEAIAVVEKALANVATNDTSKEYVDEMQKQRHEQEPVAWLEPEWGEKICPEVGYEVTITDDHPRDLCWIPLYPCLPTDLRNGDTTGRWSGKTENVGCLGMPVNVPVTASKTKERLIRIMGTFDLATGHADTFDELLDSLESELRDVLGHYREALSQPLQSEPVAWQLWVGAEPMGWQFYSTYDSLKSAEVSARTINSYQQAPFAKLVPLYTTPPQRTWVGLTDEEISEVLGSDIHDEPSGELRFIRAIEAKLKEKNI